MSRALRFSEQIRAASWGAHEDAARSAFMQALFDGVLPQDRYAELVAQHYFAYSVLEDAGRKHADDPVAGQFVFPELERVPALEADLAALVGPEWAQTIRPNTATSEYCERMREVCFEWPGSFVAHHYVRYLGDLSGGQIIRRLVEEHYDLRDHAGSSFYVFDEIDDRTAFKAQYRQLLDDVAWDANEKQRVIDEIVLAYEFNTRVLVELS